jgi:hypothetical protein
MSPIIASDTRREFRPAPEGLHNAVCIDVIDRGLQTTPWGPAHKVELRWQIDELNPDNQKRYLVSQRYTLSLNEKATLRHHLEAWRGKTLTAEDLKGFDLEKLIGFGCQLQVVHRTISDGATFANVQTIVPLAKGMPRLAPLDYVRAKDRGERGAGQAEEQMPEDSNESDENFPA